MPKPLFGASAPSLAAWPKLVAGVAVENRLGQEVEIDVYQIPQGGMVALKLVVKRKSDPDSLILDGLTPSKLDA